MPTAILPSSAAAYTPRAPPIVILKDNVSWLEQTLKGVKRAGRPLNNLKQQAGYLIEILTPKSAVWVLCSVMLENTLGIKPWCPAMSESRLWMIHIEAYVLYVDMVSQSQVAFKLTEDTINDLTKFYKEVQSPDAATDSFNWPQKQAQLDRLHEFSEAINKFVYRTNVKALEALEGDGSGELLGCCRVNAKAAILKLFVPLTPPSHVVHSLYPLVPCSLGTELHAPRPIHPFEEYQSWKTQPDVCTSNIKNHPSLGDGLNVMHAAVFPFASVGSSLYATVPCPTVEPIPPSPINIPIAAASAESFGGGSFFLF